MKVGREALVVAAACAACCAPLLVGAIAAAPVLAAGAAVTGVGAGVAAVAQRRARDSLVQATGGRQNPDLASLSEDTAG